MSGIEMKSMHGLVVVVMMYLCLFSCLAKANNTVTASGEDIARFTALVEGYVLSSKCGFGNEERRQDFRISVNAIFSSLVKRGVDATYLNKKSEQAKAIVDTEPFASCKSEARQMVAVRFSEAWDWAVDISENELQKPTTTESQK